VVELTYYITYLSSGSGCTSSCGGDLLLTMEEVVIVVGYSWGDLLY